MFDFFVLLDNGPDVLATVITVTAVSEEIVREKFPNAIRIFKK